MHKDPEYIEKLVFKFQHGETTPEELQELLTWYNSHSDERVTISTIESATGEQIRKRMLDGLMSKIRSEEVSPAPRIYRIRHWWWASSVAAVLVVFTVLWIGTRKENIQTPDLAMAVQTPQDSILPGGNKAILLLADGGHVVLNTEQQGIVMDETIHYADGQKLDKKIDLHAIEDLQLYVPKGGIYQITLRDGTQVWLNSDSRLTYPSRFSDKERVVELDGEAFFVVNSMPDVEKSTPFIVKTKSQSIEVSGTQFNVNGYSTQSFVRTTLVEGRVHVHASDKKITLQPGQQASTEGNKTLISHVQPKNYTAWKDGKFSFDGKSFEEIMTEIGRWYNLSIAYKGKIPDIELVGDAYRNERINLVLRLLDATDIHYKLDIASRTLTIY